MSKYGVPVCAPQVASSSETFIEQLAHQRRLVNNAHYDEWERWQWRRDWVSALSTRCESLTDSTLTMEAAAQGYGIAVGRTPLVNNLMKNNRLATPLDTQYPTGAAYDTIVNADVMLSGDCRRVSHWLEQAAI